jgi:hypothetical protein
MDLRWDKILVNTVNVETTTVRAEYPRITPGNPDESVLFLAILGSSEAQQMPLVGVDVRDAKAIEMLRQWITSLQP